MLGAIVGDIVGSVYEWNILKRRIFPCLGTIVFSQMTR